VIMPGPPPGLRRRAAPRPSRRTRTRDRAPVSTASRSSVMMAPCWKKHWQSSRRRWRKRACLPSTRWSC
jgi:hypothetical protein